MTHVIFSPTGPQYLISICGDQVWQWDVDGCNIKPTFDGKHVSFPADGAQFVSCNEKTVTVHNSTSGAAVSKFQITGSNLHWCSFSTDHKFVAVAAGRTAYCWNITSSEPQLFGIFVGYTASITPLVVSSPTTLISTSEDKSVKFWQIGAQSTGSAAIDPKSTPLPPASTMSITLQVKDNIVIRSDSDGMVKTWDISAGIHKISTQTPAEDCKRDFQPTNERVILLHWKGSKIHVWDTGNRELLYGVDVVHNIEGLRISGDGLRLFYLYAPFIWAWSVQIGEAMGEVKIGYSGTSGSLTVDGSKVWAHWPQSQYQGWDFGNSDSIPIQLSGMPILSNGSMLWDPRQGRIKNTVTGEVIFQLSGRFANPTAVQCDGSYLAAGHEPGEILILDLKDIML